MIDDVRDPPAGAAPASTSDRESARLNTLVEVSRAAASLDLPELVESVAVFLQGRDWACEFMSLSLYEATENALRTHLLVTPPGPHAAVHRISQGMLVPLEGTLSGRAFTTGRHCLLNSRAEYEAFTPPAWLQNVRDRFVFPPAYSVCVVPLISRGKRLGTLTFACARDHAFDADAICFLSRIADAIAPAVDNALAHQRIKELSDRLAKEKTYLEGELDAAFGEVIGDSAALRKTLTLVESVATTDSTVLILGETGTGKELIARAIHRLSKRRQRTFVKLNCASIPTGLLESELFGYERGAFTSAVAQKLGRFELADGGTFFLDEVGEIPLGVQPKLLRVLQEREFERVGGTRTIKVDARLIGATNSDLAQMQAAGTFRVDLFHRLNVFPIVVPALRERREDIPTLARHFVARSARRLRKVIDEIPDDTLDALACYEWPGNVRELENVIERAVILAPGSVLRVRPADLGIGVKRAELGRAPAERPAAAAPAVPKRLADAERECILQALVATNWMVGGSLGAAVRLGINRTTLQARMRKLGIVRPR